MRRSSRGNPYHWPAGSPKAGQFAPKGAKGAIKSECTLEEYRRRTEERLNMEQREWYKNNGFEYDSSFTTYDSDEITEYVGENGLTIREVAFEGGHISYFAYKDGKLTVEATNPREIQQYVERERQAAEANGGFVSGKPKYAAAAPPSEHKCPKCGTTLRSGGVCPKCGWEKRLGRGNPAHANPRPRKVKDDYGFECEEANGNYHFGLRGKPSETYTFYGEDYDEKKVKPIRNSLSTVVPKPTGGMWLSPSDSPWGWKEWCKAEEFRDCPDSEKQTFSLNGAKVLHVYDTNDLNQIGARKDDFGTYFPDFEELAKHYDAMEVHYSRGEGLSRGLYGWDCDSLLVFNPKVLGKKHEDDSV